MRSRTLALLLGALVVPGTVFAQADHQAHHAQAQDTVQRAGMMGQGMMSPGMMMGMMAQRHPMMGMMGMMGMIGVPDPAMILKQKDALKLNDSQVQRLEALQQEAADAHRSHMEEVEPLRNRLLGAAQSDELDLSEYESALKSLADQHVRMQVEMAGLAREAVDVLTPDQRSNLRYGIRLMRGMMSGEMMQGMMQNTPMEGCPMMMGAAGGASR